MDILSCFHFFTIMNDALSIHIYIFVLNMFSFQVLKLLSHR